MSDAPRPDWIAADWGTSALRLWVMGADGAPLAEARSEDGMAQLSPEGFEPALLRLAEPWLGGRPLPVVICGMAGARQGWREAPYRPVPCPPLGPGLLTFAATDPRLTRIAIVPGLSQARPADVMRGEETQIAGLLAAAPGFDGILCLPGTHTKWAQISAGEVVSFQTAMTGELFALLAGQSVLRHSVGPGWDPGAFAEAVSDALASPQRIAARLFEIRAASLLSGLSPATARARLSGLLIGLDLAAARPYWLGQEVVLIGEAELSSRYAEALAAQGVMARQGDATETTLAGLRAARRLLTEGE